MYVRVCVYLCMCVFMYVCVESSWWTARRS